ncbi:hypothetical protein [Saccharothrix texasensis]|uniref:hypothetical protein n=1 Tax=Saccharothrix texasensis TaxID=103734 RepID=UPI001476B3B3|nr:hypothetical protein [Saccharothrix texasensis]
MFRSKREAEELRARVADLERQVATLSSQLSATRPLLDDVTRVESLARQAEAAVRSLEASGSASRSRSWPSTWGTLRTDTHLLPSSHARARSAVDRVFRPRREPRTA